MRQRVILIFPDGWLPVAPTIINASYCLADSGFDVTVITRLRKNYGPFEFNRADIKLVEISDKRENVLRHFSGIIRELLRHTYNAVCVARLAYASLQSASSDSPLVIGVDREGIILAGLCNFIFGVKMAYLSLELSGARQETKTIFSRISDFLERRFHQKCRFSIIQDPIRWDVLSKHNKIISQKCIFISNGPIGMPKVGLDKNFFRTMFDLSPDQKVILTSGMISEMSLAKEVAKSTSNWPTKYKLVMHERERVDKDSAYIKEVVSASNGRVLLSLTPVPYDQIGLIYSGADIGLAFYKSDILNYQLVLSSSGKIAHYLQYGLPIIGNRITGLDSLVETFECGIVVDHPSEIAGAIAKIMTEYNRYSENAKRCYLEKYEFSRGFENVIKEIAAVTVDRTMH